MGDETGAGGGAVVVAVAAVEEAALSVVVVDSPASRFFLSSSSFSPGSPDDSSNLSADLSPLDAFPLRLFLRLRNRDLLPLLLRCDGLGCRLDLWLFCGATV